MPQYFKPNVLCHICGVFIPFDIVDQKHPLFGTIDHVIPKKLGGKDSAANRLPAHRHCNQFKGHEPLTDDVRTLCYQNTLFQTSKALAAGTIIMPKNQKGFGTAHLGELKSLRVWARKNLTLWYAKSIGMHVIAETQVIAANRSKTAQHIQWRKFYAEHKTAIWTLFEEPVQMTDLVAYQDATSSTQYAPELA